MKPIFIMGYMASGKTTFGRALARSLGWDFIDLDFYIEQRFRRTIRQLFEERGEDGFRRLESAMLREVGEFENVVISCGGGTPCHFDNIDYMNSRGETVWLEATVERIVERLEINRAKRPLMADKTPEELAGAVRKGLESRHEFYSQARIRFSGEQLEDRRQISQTVHKFLEEYPLSADGPAQ